MDNYIGLSPLCSAYMHGGLITLENYLTESCRYVAPKLGIVLCLMKECIRVDELASRLSYVSNCDRTVSEKIIETAAAELKGYVVYEEKQFSTGRIELEIKDVLKAKSLEVQNLKPSFPEEIIFNVTNKCFRRCIYCEVSAEYSLSGDLEENNFFDSEENILKIIHEFSEELRPRIVSVLGGEPLLHPRLPFIVKKLREKNVRINISTKGTGRYEVLEEVLEAGAHEISFSLDSTDRAIVNDMVGSKTAYDEIMSCIEIAKGYDTELSVTSILTSANFREIPRLIEFCLQNNMNHIHFIAVRPQGRCSGKLAISAEQKVEIYRCLSKAREQCRGALKILYTFNQDNCSDGICDGCMNKIKRIAVRPDGQLMSCDGRVCGNALRDSISGVWNSDMFAYNISSL
ncbi:cyclic pyranopterin monophosphate synthase [Ruminiclostridium hungatei]|uniref:Cyclic pyranopterin monophosphate synthase n=1 Tax=Ruminiclostridium hungatei TaxID=48256 RepID=A0A1V4SPI0_RUMHU|nr:radical SAM protein [Ruminiclostridium hungatei]OPX45157.1 cyclic pyranopterin monophosphate synthase [Ruminiclostridium hungatei]